MALQTIKAYGAQPGGNLLVKPRERYADIYVSSSTRTVSRVTGGLWGGRPATRVKRAQLQIMHKGTGSTGSRVTSWRRAS